MAEFDRRQVLIAIANIDNFAQMNQHYSSYHIYTNIKTT